MKKKKKSFAWKGLSFGDDFPSQMLLICVCWKRPECPFGAFNPVPVWWEMQRDAVSTASFNGPQYLNTEGLGESLDAHSVELPVGQIPRAGSENLRLSVVLQFVFDVQMSFTTKSIWFF